MSPNLEPIRVNRTGEGLPEWYREIVLEWEQNGETHALALRFDKKDLRSKETLAYFLGRIVKALKEQP